MKPTHWKKVAECNLKQGHNIGKNRKTRPSVANPSPKIQPLRKFLGKSTSRESGVYLFGQGFMLTDASFSNADKTKFRQWIDALNLALYPVLMLGCGFDFSQKLVKSGPVETAQLRECLPDLASTFDEIEGLRELQDYRSSTLTFHWRQGDGSISDCSFGATSSRGELAGNVSESALVAANRMLSRQAQVSSALALSFSTFMPASGIKDLYLMAPRPRPSSSVGPNRVYH